MMKSFGDFHDRIFLDGILPDLPEKFFIKRFQCYKDLEFSMRRHFEINKNSKNNFKQML